MMFYNFDSLFQRMRYPAGESHLVINERVLPLALNTLIVAPGIRNFEDIANLVQANAILDHVGIVYNDITWLVPYFPFGRHDRRRNIYDGLEIKQALEMVEHMNVVTIDPHSDMLGQLKHIPQRVVLEEMTKKFPSIMADDPVFVIPDNGATKKAMDWLGDRDYVQGVKYRDPSTGKLSGFGIESGSITRAMIHGRPCVIVDDICDGGGTFFGLAEELRRYVTPSCLKLIVTHGLFTKGTEALLKTFKHIYTTTHSQPGTRYLSPVDLYERGEFV